MHCQWMYILKVNKQPHSTAGSIQWQRNERNDVEIEHNFIIKKSFVFR